MNQSIAVKDIAMVSKSARDFRDEIYLVSLRGNNTSAVHFGSEVVSWYSLPQLQPNTAI
jgi:hypothetical protein